MGEHLLRLLFLTQLMLSFSAAHAQPPVAEALPAADNPVPPVFPLRYFSVFTTYHPFQEHPQLPWREANDAVGKIGGWRFYAREPQNPDTNEIPAGPGSGGELQKPVAAPSFDQHSGHGSNP